ncbi:uncharacterized protein LOC123512751 isoform X2 [Portunus trituberculatus]|uniref:uncharacterized protein LOC123512751 isoform X2 n=1 Tax=Portunus trituberculatus TaxID=210409 RepID=UPI001E1CE89A|nr:uncharacterized protein LOC123512751 isoform X2 [Portunus trituberculatus]
MTWLAWYSLAATLVAAVQLAAAMPSGSGHKRPSHFKGGSNYVGFDRKELHQRLHGRHYSSTYDPDYYRDECLSQGLTCVPEDDCVAKTPNGYLEGRVCPINFVPHNSLCVLPGIKNKVEPRTQAQVVDYCARLRTRPYYFQNAKEWRDFYGFVGQHAAEYYDLFMLDSRWDEDHERWEWLSTGDEIEWEKILQHDNCSLGNKELVREESGCLAFSVDRTSNCLRLRRIECTDTSLPFFCKDGSYESRCGQNENSLCCAVPTYSYYSKNKYGGPGSHGIHGASKRECWIKLDYPTTKTVTCHRALDVLGNLHPYPQPVRVGRSYYYFSRNPCRLSRQAVVSGMEVHDFITSYLLTEEVEIEEQIFIVGLRYDTKEDEFFWVNGKRVDYYNNETFWASGQPDKQSGTSKVSCVSYKKNGKNSYAWHLYRAEECAGPAVVNVCEMPIRSTKLVPSAKKVECGQRLERGVLARSFYKDVGYDDEEAQYGEFPWHVAVLQPSTYYDGVVMVFVCSGVLIHPEYVLTSAHCVIYSGNGDFSVSFGEWDLNDDSGQILETKLVAVNDVIIHPEHKSTSLMHDVALLQLEGKVDVDSYPHFGMGCLPYPRVFYYASHAWDCFTVGWPATKQGRTDRRVLQRIESDFLSSGRCRRYTKTYYDSAREYGKEGEGYDKEYGAHHLYYEHHGYFEDKFVPLICTEPYESDSCLDDNTPILVCKKASFVADDPLTGGVYDGPGEHYGDDYGPGDKYYGPGDKHYGPGDHYRGPGDKYDGPDHYRGPGDKHYGPGDHYRGPSYEHHGPDRYGGPKEEHYGSDDHYRGPRESHHAPDHYRGPEEEHYGPDDHHKRPSGHRGRAFGSTHSNRLRLWNSRIVNPFGDDRFDSDRWYVMGIGHDLNSCDSYGDTHKADSHHSKHRRPHQVFTPVHKYLSFIHQHLEPQPATEQDVADYPDGLAPHAYPTQA